MAQHSFSDLDQLLAAFDAAASDVDDSGPPPRDTSTPLLDEGKETGTEPGETSGTSPGLDTPHL